MEKDVLSMTCSIDSHVNTHKSILMIVFEDKVVIVGWDRQTGLCKLLFFFQLSLPGTLFCVGGCKKEVYSL